MLHLAADNSLHFNTCLAIIARLHVLATQFPSALTQEIFAAIEDGRKRLTKSINNNREFPARQDLILFYTVGQIYETSDLSHTIVNATTLFMSQILSQMRVRSIQDIARGLFICSVFLQVIILLLSEIDYSIKLWRNGYVLKLFNSSTILFCSYFPQTPTHSLRLGQILGRLSYYPS